MKTILTRSLIAALLATSISAFAQSGDEKRDDAASPSNVTQQAAATSNVTQQNSCNPDAEDASRQDKQNSQDEAKSQIEQQDKDWLHDLLGTYGG